MAKKKEEKLGDALLKAALGCRVAEVTEEYAEVDGQLKLLKRKRVEKDVPPDVKAMQLLLAAGGGDSYADMTDEELEKEKEKLLEKLKAKKDPEA